MNFEALLHDISAIATTCGAAAGRTADRLLTLRNWVVGAYIVEYEQNGEDRAAYGDQLQLAAELTRAGQEGLGVSSLKNCRQVALTWPGLDIRQTLSGVFGPGTRICQTLSGEFTSEPARRQRLSAESKPPAPERGRASGGSTAGSPA